MANKIDMSLDDIINAKRFRGRGRGRGNRRFLNNPRKNVSNRSMNGKLQTSKNTYPKRKVSQPNVFLSGANSFGGTGKLLISNLDFGVTDSDIQELFGEFGPVLSASVHYDKTGRSLQTANVIFEKKLDGLQAIKKYNNIPLDGKT
ncbi:unnamed protein product [Gordionus sp. m RMFG-2023]